MSENTFTVNDLISALQKFDKGIPVLISSDGWIMSINEDSYLAVEYFENGEYLIIEATNPFKIY